jgi:hypothetical protein
MLVSLHSALQRLLREQGRIGIAEVDVTFEAPTRERIERLVKPAINLFLFDVQENTELRQTNLQAGRENGHVTRRMPPRRIDLRYLVSALTTDIEDEHALLWRTLETLLRFPELPRELLSEEAQVLDMPIVAKVTPSDEGRRLMDLWSALGVPPRPAIYYVVTAPIDLELTIQSPLVLTRTMRYGRTDLPGTGTEERINIGGVVRDEAGAALAGVTVTVEGSAAEATVTDPLGRYRLLDVPVGTINLRITRPDGSAHIAMITVPADNYDVHLELPAAPIARPPAGREPRRMRQKP